MSDSRTSAQHPAPVASRPRILTALTIAAIPLLTVVGGLTVTGWTLAGSAETGGQQVLVAER